MMSMMKEKPGDIQHVFHAGVVFRQFELKDGDDQGRARVV